MLNLCGGRAPAALAPACCVYNTHLFGARQRTLCACRHALALCLVVVQMQSVHSKRLGRANNALACMTDTWLSL
jgi:hypothetical protein